MRLRNKKTGEIVDTLCRDDITKGLAFGVDHHDGNPTMAYYNSLAELNEEWEDYEEKDHWYINYQGEVYVLDPNAVPEYSRNAREIGNYFETKEEAEKAVERLRAWKRLKEAGFEFGGWTHTPITKSLTGYNLHIKAYSDKLADYMDDLQTLFGGEG